MKGEENIYDHINIFLQIATIPPNVRTSFYCRCTLLYKTSSIVGKRHLFITYVLTKYVLCLTLYFLPSL